MNGPVEILSQQQEGRQVRWVTRGFDAVAQQLVAAHPGIQNIRSRPATLDEIFVACTRGVVPKAAESEPLLDQMVKEKIRSTAKLPNPTSETMNSSANMTVTAPSRFPIVTLAFQRLCWKEARQIAPLAIALLAINAVLHLLPISDNPADLRGLHMLLLNLMPCLFASGAGAMLISQEKEQRTVGWLNSLPIAWRQILGAKLFVGISYLTIVWLACVLTTLIFDRELPRELVSPVGLESSVQLTVINSIFLLFLGSQQRGVGNRR